MEVKKISFEDFRYCCLMSKYSKFWVDDDHIRRCHDSYLAGRPTPLPEGVPSIQQESPTEKLRRLQLIQLNQKSLDFSALVSGHLGSIRHAGSDKSLKKGLEAEHDAVIENIVSLRHELGQYLNRHMKEKRRKNVS